MRWRWWRPRWPTGPYLGPNPPGRPGAWERQVRRGLCTVALLAAFVGALVLLALVMGGGR